MNNHIKEYCLLSAPLSVWDQVIPNKPIGRLLEKVETAEKRVDRDINRLQEPKRYCEAVETLCSLAYLAKVSDQVQSLCYRDQMASACLSLDAALFKLSASDIPLPDRTTHYKPTRRTFMDILKRIWLILTTPMEDFPSNKFQATDEQPDDSSSADTVLEIPSGNPRYGRQYISNCQDLKTRAYIECNTPSSTVADLLEGITNETLPVIHRIHDERKAFFATASSLEHIVFLVIYF